MRAAKHRLNHETRRIKDNAEAWQEVPEMAKAVDRGRLYEPQEAIDLLKSIVKANYDHTVEVAIRLGVDPGMRTNRYAGPYLAPRDRKPPGFSFCQGREGQRSRGSRCRSGWCGRCN